MRWKSLCLIGGIVGVCFTAHAGNGLTIRFENSGLVIEGVGPETAVAVMGAARRLDDWAPMVFHEHALVRDDDRDGVVRYRPGYPIPPLSVWAAVEVASGSSVVASPEAETRTMPLPLASLDGEDGSFDRLLLEGRQFDVLVVRPGIGAWSGSVADGGVADVDATGDGVASLGVGHLRPLDSFTDTSVSSLRDGDRVVVIAASRVLAAEGTLVDGTLADGQLMEAGR